MTAPDDVLAPLRHRLDGLAAWQDGTGDPLDLGAALLPDAPPAEAAVASALAQPPPAGGDRAARLALFAAVRHLAPTLPEPWQDAFDDLFYDLTARPSAYRDLSAFALELVDTAGLPDTAPAGRLLLRAAHAALEAPPPELLDEARAHVMARRRAARWSRWRAWLAEVADAAWRPLRDAVDTVSAGAAPLAAAAGPVDALARVVLGEALGGEVTLAVLPGAVVVEWDGDGAPPDGVEVDGQPATPAHGTSHAPATWVVDLPPHGPLAVTLARGHDTATVAR